MAPRPRARGDGAARATRSRWRRATASTASSRATARMRTSLALDLGLGHPLTGPVYVEGAEPGDVVDIEFLAYETADFGVTAVIPGFGFLADLFTDPYLVKWEIAGGTARSPELPGVTVRGRPVRRRRRRRAVARADGRDRAARAGARGCRRPRCRPPAGDGDPCRCERRPAHDSATGDRRQPRHPPARRGLAHHAARFTSRGRSSRSETSTSPRATARSAAPASRWPAP